MTDAEATPPRRRGIRRRTIAIGAAAAIAVTAGVVVLVTGSKDEVAKVARTTELTSAAGGPTIELTPAFRDAAGIATEAAAEAPLAPVITVVGEAVFDPTLVAAVGTRAAGIVKKVHFVEGQTVKKGELLAEIESSSLTDAHAERRIAAAKKAAAAINAERERKLLERGLTTAREYEQSLAQLAEQSALEVAAEERVAALGGNQAATGTSELRAPTGGLIAERAIAPGQSVGPGIVAFRVGSMDRLWVLLRVFERHLQLLRSGDVAEIVPVAAPDRRFHGTVSHVGAVIDPTTHTANVRVDVANDERRLRPGQAVQAMVRASGPARSALSVPASAITSVDGVPTVFVAETATRFVARKVELGLDGGERVELKSGVAAGETVVTKSVLALKSELFR